jgi:hypothetical protein
MGLPRITVQYSFKPRVTATKGVNHAGTLSLSFPPASQTHSPGGGYSMLGGAASGSPGRHRLRGPQTAAEGKGGHGTGQAWGTGGTRTIWYYSRLHAHAAGQKGELSPRVTWTDPKGIQRDRRKWEARGGAKQPSQGEKRRIANKSDDQLGKGPKHI